MRSYCYPVKSASLSSASVLLCVCFMQRRSPPLLFLFSDFCSLNSVFAMLSRPHRFGDSLDRSVGTLYTDAHIERFRQRQHCQVGGHLLLAKMADPRRCEQAKIAVASK